MIPPIKTGTIVRTIVLFIALFNQIAVSLGYSIIDINNDMLEEFLTNFLTIATSIICWWKNNSFTESAIIADDILQEMRDK